MTLRVIEALCISYGYNHNSNNQSLFATQGGLIILLDFIRKGECTDEFKCRVYYTLSMVCFSNSKVTSELFKLVDRHELIIEMQELLTSAVPSNLDRNEEIDRIATQIEAGLVLCGFFYQNEGTSFWSFIVRFRTIVLGLSVHPSVNNFLDID